MDTVLKKEDAMDPRKPVKISSKKTSQPTKVSSKKRKQKKRKKPFRLPSKLFASIWWIVAIATFTIGGIGLVHLILKLYERGAPNWSYALSITTSEEEVRMVAYGFKGNKRDLNLRMEDAIVYRERFASSGVNDRFRYAFKKAEELIPWLSRSSSSCIFAGSDDLRLLKIHNRTIKNDVRYNNIVNDLDKLLSKSRLMAKKVRVLQDWEEAFHGWITLNYLSGYLSKGRQPIKAMREIFTTRYTLGGLDMGPTSFHVSYEVPNIHQFALAPGVKENTRDITLYGREYYIYTHSWLCYGVNSISDMYFSYKFPGAQRYFLDYVADDYFFRNFIPVERVIPVGCVGHGGFDRFENSAIEYRFFYRIGLSRLRGTCSQTSSVMSSYKHWHPRTVSKETCVWGFIGESCKIVTESKFSVVWDSKHLSSVMFVGEGNFTECYKDLKEIIDNCSKHFPLNPCPEFKAQPERPYSVTFVGFNKIGFLAGIENEMSEEKWKKATENICSEGRKITVVNQPKETMCLKMTYMYVILKDKLKFSKEEWKKLKFSHDIDKTTISWDLGYVMNVTDLLPTVSPFLESLTPMDILKEALIFAAILSVSSIAAAFALRNSDTLAQRVLQLPQ